MEEQKLGPEADPTRIRNVVRPPSVSRAELHGAGSFPGKSVHLAEVLEV